jgi:hypothetical protein
MDWLGGDRDMHRFFVSTTSAICALATAMPAAASWFYTTDDVGLAAELVGSDLVPDIGANRTYRIWAVLPENWRIDALAGNGTTAMRFEVVGGTFYQNVYGGPTSTSINEGFFALAPELEWDSFLTIGLLSETDNSLLDLGIDWAVFEASGNVLETSNGSVFVLPTDVQGDPTAFTDACGTTGNGVLIAQFTLVGEGATLEGSVLVQGHDDQGQTFQTHISSFAIDAEGVSDALPAVACAADITGDGEVDVTDLLELVGHWLDGSCEDITRDLIVDSDDILMLVDSWGSCGG